MARASLLSTIFGSTISRSISFTFIEAVSDVDDSCSLDFENERWSQYAMDEDDGISSETDDTFSSDLGDEWKNWRVHDPELEKPSIGEG